MHIWVRFLVACSLVNAAAAQSRPIEPAHPVLIRTLVIESNSLPAADRERVVSQFQQKTYPEDEIADRVRWALRNVGYINAAVAEPEFSFPTGARDTANVTVKVDSGVQYHLGEIRIVRATVFPPDQLRNVFSQQKGDLFDVSKFGEGLESLRKLYATRGYVDMVSTPVVKADDVHHTINMQLEVDEGQTYYFGNLYLEGVEPHAGAAQDLVNSWKPLEGTPYNPEELQHWLLEHRFAREVATQASDSIKTSTDAESRRVNVTLTQWPTR